MLVLMNATTLHVGSTLEVGTIRVHRFADSFRVTDLGHAGKRGQRVRTASVATDASADGLATALAACESFNDVVRLVADLAADYPGEYRITHREERGVDVLAAGVVRAPRPASSFLFDL